MVKRLRTARQTGHNRTLHASRGHIGCHAYPSSFLFSFFETLFRTGLMPPSVVSIFWFFEEVVDDHSAESSRFEGSGSARPHVDAASASGPRKEMMLSRCRPRMSRSSRKPSAT